MTGIGIAEKPRPQMGRLREREAPWKDPAATAYIRIERVSKKFGDFTAVDDVTLDIYRGEIFCLLGGSGCGKTTLLRMLAGSRHPPAVASSSMGMTWQACRPSSGR